MWPSRRPRPLRPLPPRRPAVARPGTGNPSAPDPVTGAPLPPRMIGFAFSRPADSGRAEAGLWLRQGDRDLESARESCRAGDYVWACFQAQRTAEMALKALLLARGGQPTVRAHSVAELVGEVAALDASFAALVVDAKRLDAVSVTTRNPDKIAGNLTPSEYFGREYAEACIRSAAAICDAARRTLAG